MPIYTNSIHMDLKDFYNSGSAPTEITKINIDEENKFIEVMVAYHYQNHSFKYTDKNISETSYKITELKAIAEVTKALSGKITLREAFNKVGHQCQPGSNMVDHVIKSCRLLFDFLGLPFHEEKRRIIDESLQEKLENYIQLAKKPKQPLSIFAVKFSPEVENTNEPKLNIQARI